MDLGKRLRLRVVDSTNDQVGGWLLDFAHGPWIEIAIPPLRSSPHVRPQPNM